MLVWTTSIAIAGLLIFMLGWLLGDELDKDFSESLSRRIITSVGLGLTFLVILSYILIGTIGFSGINSIIVLSLVIGFLILRRVLIRVVYIQYPNPNQIQIPKFKFQNKEL